MTRVEALKALIRTPERRSQPEANRLIRACKTLGLNAAETIEVLGFLDYCDCDARPYPAANGKPITLSI